MVVKKNEKFDQLGASITATEIYQQPSLWEETFSIYNENRDNIKAFLNALSKKYDHIRVIFTGAGTSAYVGETITPLVKERMDEKKWEINSVPTTSIVSNPHQYFKKEIPTLLVSFARSGNSPESVASVNLGTQIVDDFYQMTITCSADGELARSSKGDDKNLLLLMPEKSNDQGFAMTGSYTCMTLAALLVFGNFDSKTEEKLVNQVVQSGRSVLQDDTKVEELLNQDFERIIYLGSGSLEGLAREAQLKVLELTAGRIATSFDSSLGFRHGPKSFVNEKTLVFLFVSNNSYTRKYDLDMLNELRLDGVAQQVTAVQVDAAENFEGETFSLNKEGQELPDAFLALPYVLVGQLISLFASVETGNEPDNPSPTGTVNRVVKGVTIHEYKGN